MSGAPTWELPRERQLVSGRTFSAPWGPLQGAAIERPAPRAARRARDLAFGLAMAGVVALVVYPAMTRGWIFGGVPA